MRSIKFALLTAVLFSLASLAQAATISGTVTDKTTGKPAAGDKVELVDVQAGMSVADTAKTDASGRYSLKKPGSGPYLVRVTHQGSPYFIAAPESGAADVPVFDAAPAINGISLEGEVIELETQNGQVQVLDRYILHNASSPPRTQYEPGHGFEVVLPADAVVDGASGKRPTGLPTQMELKPAGAKNRFTFDFPIQPDDGDKDTEFSVTYHLPYASGRYSFRPQVTLPAQYVGVLLPMNVTFAGSGFRPIKKDPGIQTMVANNVQPGPGLEFTISGTGALPRENQGQPTSSGDAAAQDSTPTGPGGGIGTPINTPDPLSKYKWWILLGMFLGLSAVAGFLLRRPAGMVAAPVNVPVAPVNPVRGSRRAAAVSHAPALEHAPVYAAQPSSPASHNATLLAVLKEEMFAIESEKLSGVISAAEYKEQKGALETVLRRALRKSSS